jgi:hypothetical protein
MWTRHQSDVAPLDAAQDATLHDGRRQGSSRFAAIINVILYLILENIKLKFVFTLRITYL